MSNQPHSPVPSSRHGTESPTDALFEVLASRYRRLVLAELARSRTPTTVPELARRVTAQEIGCPVADVPDDECDSVESVLYHAHLPKLADHEFVEYDPERAVVASSARTVDAIPFLELVVAE
ncbi:DUF7344 domain-containing protein [Halomicrococcus gelatinilyticus]|uniref:DUF7344 domain-containing protein n=1 Tax=Halomicrococcus gelatinilyticus TaxID=1702103 RepID=UPI002E158EC3